MASKSILWPPTKGDAIRVRPDASLEVPDHPIIPFIEGDGTGPDIWRTSVRVLDAAVAMAFGGKKKIAWYEVYAGEKANTLYGEALWLPDETVEAITKYVVAIKGPLTTPIGGDFRSINVTLRQIMDLYCCVRPVRYFSGVPSPMRHPEKLNIVLFRENCEDVYAGIEWPAGSTEANDVIALAQRHGKKIRPDSAIGVKPMSAFGSKRLIRRGIQYALSHGRRTVTLVHKGNIMKYTEGAFRGWGYDLARDEFADKVITEDDVWSRYGGELPAGKVMLQDRVADAMFQQLMVRPDEYDVLCTPNLNGDYLSDAAAAQVGGLGIAHGGNIGDKGAVFEATHGTAPKFAGQDKVNPGSVILSGALMLEHLGWNEAAKLVIAGVEGAVAAKTVTNDFARQMPGSREVKCSEFGSAIIEHMR